MNKVLVVEDEKDVRENLTDILESEDFNVMSFPNAFAALENIESFNPDLIVSDISMPGMSGYEFLNQLREMFDVYIPVIFLSARTSREEVREGMNCGADDYITKPFSALELITAVNTRLKIRSDRKKNIEGFTSNLLRFVSHELRTPLVSILGYSDMMSGNLTEYREKDIREMIDLIKKSGSNLSEKIEKFLFFAEVETNLEISKQRFNEDNEVSYINETSSLMDMFDPEFLCERKNDLKFELANGTLKIKKEYFEFLINVLVKKAAKQTPPGNLIKLTGKKHSLHYKISVTSFAVELLKEELKRSDDTMSFNRHQIDYNSEKLEMIIINRIIKIYNINIKCNKENRRTISLYIPLME